MKKHLHSYLLILISTFSAPTFAYDLKEGFKALQKLSAQEAPQVDAVNNSETSVGTSLNQSKKHPRECLSKVNYYPYQTGSAQMDKIYERFTTTKMIEDAEKLRESVCSQILGQESDETIKSQNEYFPNHCVISTASEHNQNGRGMEPHLIANCISSLTGLDLIQNNQRFLGLYNKASEREALDLAAKDKAQQSDLQVRSIEKFSVKDIELGISKKYLVKTNVAKYWRCTGVNADTDQEVCDLSFVSSNEKSCQPVVYSTLFYGKIYVDNCKTKVIYLDANKLPADLKNLSTLGGEKVWSIQANFYKDKLHDLKVYVPVSEDLVQAITNKYGPPNVEWTTWVGAKEELSYKGGFIHLSDKSVLAEINQNIKAKADAERSIALTKAQEISKKKRQDF